MDDTPEGEDIKVEVRRLQMGQAGGSLGMREEQLKFWLREATQENYSDTRCWDKLASVTKLLF